MWSGFWSTMASAITFEQDAHIPCASFLSAFSLNESMAHAVGLPFELHEPAVMDDAVDGRRHLVASEDRPQRENLHVRGDHDRLSLVVIREYLEQKVRPVGVGRQGNPVRRWRAGPHSRSTTSPGQARPRLVCV